MNRHRFHFPRAKLPLEEVIQGVRHWAVAMDRAMLTFFEVRPGSRFDSHSHEGEQITLLLEGELFILFDDGEVCMQPGDVVVIPPGVRHAALTKDVGCEAVDAWSPPEPRYRPTEQTVCPVLRLP